MQIRNIIGFLLVCALITAGCSTTGNFKIPADTTLYVTDRPVELRQNGDWKTSPFFWSSAGGAAYTLKDKNGNVLRTGKVKTNFRVVSIFWPPFALIYWPMGLSGDYDLTKPGDGVKVTDATGTVAPAAAPAKTKKK